MTWKFKISASQARTVFPSRVSSLIWREVDTHDGGKNMGVSVVRNGTGHRLAGDSAVAVAANRFLSHLEARQYSPATVRAYAFDLGNFGRFLEERRLDQVED